MRKKIPALLAILHFVFSSVALAGTISGSPHDFLGYSGDESGEICKPCHAPHQTKPLPAPLWNQELTTDTYTMYDSTPTSLLKTAPPASIDAKMRLQPESSSKMCLSCHDGTVAHENFGDLADGAIPPHGDALTSADLGMDHPISFVYDTSLSVIERDLYDPATKLSGIVGSMGTINDDMLFEGRMECSTCHDVHNKRAVAGTKLLLKDNAGSSLCLTCHDK